MKDGRLRTADRGLFCVEPHDPAAVTIARRRYVLFSPTPSMAVSREEVHRIARLARLHFSKQEEARLAGELDRILAYVEKLNEVDTTGAPPMMHGLDLPNVFRTDEAGEPLSREQALENAPDTDEAHFRVPKAVG